MSVAEKLILTAEAYLQGEETAEYKHEYQQGEIWMMAGATARHISITMNLGFLLKQKLKGTACRTYISDMKVNVEKANAFFYPDVVVSCNTKDKQQALYKQHPVFIAEVLSPSTEAFDRGAKFFTYRQLESLQTYWLINTQTQQVDSFTRTTNNEWLMHNYTDSNETLPITALDIGLVLNDLYEDID